MRQVSDNKIDATSNRQIALGYYDICLGDNSSFKKALSLDHCDTPVLGVDCERFSCGQDEILSSIQLSDGSSQVYVYDALCMSHDDEEFVKYVLESPNFFLKNFS